MMGEYVRRTRKPGMLACMLIVVLPCVAVLVFVLYADELKSVLHTLETDDNADSIQGTDPHRSFQVAGLMTSIAVSPNGKHIAVGSFPWDTYPIGVEPLTVWDLATGKQVASLEDTNAPFHYAQTVTFSPDGKYLTANTLRDSSGDVTVWETVTWSVVKRLQPKNAENASAIAFSPDSRLLATFAQRRSRRTAPRRSAIFLWCMTRGELLTTLDMQADSTNDLVFSRDGSRLACCAGGGVSVWDLSTFREYVIRTTNGPWHGNPRFSLDGKSLMVLEGNNLCVLDIRTKREMSRSYVGPNVRNVTYLHNTQRVAVTRRSGRESFITIYDYGIRREVASFAHHTHKKMLNRLQWCDCLSEPAASVGGRFLYRVRNGHLSIWDISAMTHRKL